MSNYSENGGDMRHLKKKLLALGMAFGMLLGAVARAEEPSPSPEPIVPTPEPSVAVPDMARVTRTKAKLSISKRGKARLSGTIKEDSSITRIVGTVSLEKYSPSSKKWRKIKVWKVARNGSGLSVSYGYQLPKKRKKGAKKGKYRARVRMFVYKGTSERGMPACDFSKTRKY